MNQRTFAHMVYGLGLLFCFPLAAQWAPLGPFGGPAAVVVADPHVPKTFLAATRNALLFRTSDGGDTWRPLPFPAQLRANLNALAIDPQTPGIYLAALSSDLSQYAGILRSTDAGATWHQVADLRKEQVRSIAIKWANSQLMAAGTETGVFLSENGGAEWKRISPEENNQLRPVVSVAFDPKDGNTLYAGTPHLPWKTSDGGENWHSISTGMIDDSDIFSIQPDRNRPQRLFAAACSGVYRTVTGGAGWARLASASRTYVVAQDPQFENVWFAGTVHGLVQSRDGGGTWDKVGPYATRSIAFDPGRLGRILIATDEAGILRSDDNGKTWQPVNNGFCNRHLSTFWRIGGDLYTVSEEPAGGSIFRMSAVADEWRKVMRSDAVLTAMLAVPWNGNLLLAGTEAGAWITEDATASWRALGPPLAGTRIHAFSALDRGWLAATGSAGIFVSRDGEAWKQTSPAAKGEVYDVAPAGDRVLIAATADGLRRSTDFGASWRPSGGELARTTVQAICRHPVNASTLFAATYGVIYTSTDSGGSWRRLTSEEWPVTSVKQLMVTPGSPDRLLVLTPQQGIWEVAIGRMAADARQAQGSKEVVSVGLKQD